MKRFELNIDPKKKYVVACSYGPDSMALLNMTIDEKLNIVVAHVNYHKRDASNQEEAALKEFCNVNKIQIEVLDTKDLKCDGNFQDWARKIRYSFFKKILEKYNADAVLVAHQQDDFIETYLMQKKRANIVKNPGIAEITTIDGVEIIRPLLNFSKADLLEYNKTYNVPFSIDCSNLTNQYERNKIRHEIVEKMSKIEREKVIEDAADHANSASIKTKWPVDVFADLPISDVVFSISDFVEKRIGHHDVSSNFVRETQSAFKTSKPNVSVKLWGGLYISKEYGFVRLLDLRNKVTYFYELKQNERIDNELFTIDFRNASGDRNVSKDDFPIAIKPVQSKEKYAVGSSQCEVRRLFIDWKLPKHLRNCWPGIYNKYGRLIYIPRYRENYIDNHPSKFVIKFVD